MWSVMRKTGEEKANNRVIKVTGEATVGAKPDQAVISLNVSELSANYSEAVSGLDSSVNEIKTALSKLHIDVNLLKTSSFNVNTEYEGYSDDKGVCASGLKEIEGKTYYFDKSTGVMRTGKFTVGNVTYETDKDGVLIFKGENTVKDKKTTKAGIKGFANGSHRISRDQIGWTNERGQELLYRKSSGAIMTPLSSGDKVFTNEMANNLWNMSQSGGLESLVKNIIHGNGFTDGYEALRSGLASLGQTSVQQNFDNITFNLPNVTDYRSFIKQMQTDKNFEKFIQSMTIGRINGKPSDMKRHINF